MKTLCMDLDFISPYAWLAFASLPQALQGVSHEVVYRPVLFGGLLKHHGQLGPAEIPAKRDWTYRQVLWLARERGIELRLPAAHPFNPLALLRLAVACDPQGLPSRYVCEKVFRHVWCTGLDAADPARLQELTDALAPARDPDSPEVKQQLQAHTASALERGVFGVPSWRLDDKLFWGLDALPMVRACMTGDDGFDGPDRQAVSACAVGVRRRP